MFRKLTAFVGCLLLCAGLIFAQSDDEGEWFWNQPLRKGGRRYYDNCLYLFAFLALSGRYRIW